MSRVLSHDSPSRISSLESPREIHFLDRTSQLSSHDSPSRIITVQRTGRRAPHAPTIRRGFSLAEVVIVSVVLTVLLAAVWSLFSLQQRTLERGQRLSRQSRVMLAVQRLFQDDFARAVVTYSSSVSVPRTTISQSAVETTDDPRFASSLGFSETSDVESFEQLVAPEFLFSGGSDWLIVDVRRPAHQWGAFDVTNSTNNDDELDPISVGATSNQYSQNDPDALPITAPTPFERVIYLWLTDAEVESVTGFVFGYEDPSRAATESSNREFARNSGDATVLPRKNNFGGDSEASEFENVAPLPRRTLLRIRTDWSWPRDNENVGTTWDDALANDSAATDLSGFDDELGGLSPARQAWLRRLLWSTRSAYREFHLQAGSAVRLGQETSEATDVNSTATEDDSFADDWNNASDPPSLDSAGSNWQRQLPNAREPQVDWFPEIAAGKFQYFDGTRWQDSFATRDDQAVPWAVRLEYELDSDRYPGPIDLENLRQDSRADADSLLTIDPRNDEVFLDGPTNVPSSSLSTPRPEFPQMVVWTFRQQAARGSRSTDLSVAPFVDGETGSEINNETNREESSDANSSGFAEAFRSTTTSETGDR